MTLTDEEYPSKDEILSLIQQVEKRLNNNEFMPLERGILLEDLASNQIYYLIMDGNLEKNYYPFTAELNYSKFIDDFNQLNCEYVLFNKSNTNMMFIQNFTTDFDILYENVKGLFFAKRIFINESALL